MPGTTDIGGLSVNLDLTKANELLKTQPRVHVTMTHDGKELTLVEISKAKLNPGALAADNQVNVLC